ncbi:MAG: hypothetical protein EAZ55_09205 [Cytophagales bacterium]|nr:MAG: hypothetical protein EAZ55_09205 [Cytophagales bacterium]
MRKIILTLFVSIFFIELSIAQKGVNVTVKSELEGCWVALISEKEANDPKYQFGWWDAWHAKKKAKSYKNAPATFTKVPKGKYVIVIYNPASDYSKGDVADGVVLEEVEINDNASFEIKKDDFKDWNCLSCPWLYVWNGQSFIKTTEVIKDVVGKKNEKSTFATLTANDLVGTTSVRIRIQEEKEEISYLNQIVLEVGNQTYLPYVAEEIDEKLTKNDSQYLTLKKGESVEIVFTLKAPLQTNQKIVLKTSGYYEPDAVFLSNIYEYYLKK